MEFIDVLRQEMGSCGITVKELAKRLYIAPNTISTWFNRGEVPDAMEGRVTEAINSPRLSEERCSQCEGNAFPTRYLDNVNDHPSAAINKARSEITEWLAIVERASDSTLNKCRGAVFTKEEEAEILKFENETADLITSMKTILIRFQEFYNRPVVATMNRHVAKLEQSGYCSVTKRKAAPYQQSC